jgi:hypothetical protein
MSWEYKKPGGFGYKSFDDSDIPEGAIGFVYEMIAVVDSKVVSYIGKKNFYSSRKKKFSKKFIAQMTDKRAKKYIVEKKLNYQNYYSSNVILKKAYKEGRDIQRRILKICFSKAELTYEETKYQFKLEVLEKEEYLNGNILGRFYKQIKTKKDVHN